MIVLLNGPKQTEALDPPIGVSAHSTCIMKDESSDHILTRESCFCTTQL